MANKTSKTSATIAEKPAPVPGTAKAAAEPRPAAESSGSKPTKAAAMKLPAKAAATRNKRTEQVATLRSRRATATPPCRLTSQPCRTGKATSVDALIVRAVPGGHKGVKWRSPLYGIEGEGWFLGLHCFTKYVKVAFFRGMSLHPVLPGASKSGETRYLHIHEDEQFDKAQFAAWVKQASQLPGERM